MNPQRQNECGELMVREVFSALSQTSHRIVSPQHGITSIAGMREGSLFPGFFPLFLKGEALAQRSESVKHGEREP